MTRTGKAKHRQIYEHIHSGIVSGDYHVGERIPTEAELGIRFDSSRVTVARAVRELERQGYLVRRRGAGTFVREPRKNASGLIGMITGESSGVSSLVSDEISRAAQLSGLSVILGKWPVVDASERLRRADTLSEQYLAHPVSGVILEPMMGAADALEWNTRVIQNFTRARVPVILLEREVVEYPRRSPLDLVGIDHRHAGHLVTTHLLSLGRRRIEFVSQSARTPSLSARMRGWQDALIADGIKPAADGVHLGQTIELESIRRLTRRNPPDAFICSSDFEAAALLQALTALGFRVPGDMAIVGFNDDPCARLLPVSLTTVRPPASEVGRAAVAAMLDRLENPAAPPREIRLACELIVRDSCGAALRAAAPSGKP